MNGPATPYLAEVTEDAARGEIARIYGEIRQLCAVPFVALIYRHLATLPGALEAVWQAARPMLESGQLQERVWQLGRDAWTGSGVDPTDALRSLDRDAVARIGDVITAYNRANPVNLAIVALIRQAPRDDAGTSTGAEPKDWAPPPTIRALPPIPSMAMLPAAVRGCVDAFAKPGPPGTPVLVPTLYRHLAHWPAFLELARREVLPRLAAGTLQPDIDRFRSAIEAEAASRGRAARAANEPLLRELAPVLDRFAAVIPEMVVVGSVLFRSLAGRFNANPGPA